MKGRGMTKAKKWKIGIIVFLGLVATVLIAIEEGRFWKYQQNYIPDGTYQMVKYEAKSAYSNELINWTERGENNDSLYEDFIVVENMKSQFYYVFVGDGEPFVSPFEHDEKLPQTFDPRTGTLKQDLTVSEYKALVISHIDKISKKGEEYSNVKEVSVQRCVDDYKKMLKQKRTYEKRPNGLVLTVYADDGHIESRRTFKRLSSEEAKEVKSGYDRDYEYALKYYNYSRHDGDYLIWR